MNRQHLLILAIIGTGSILSGLAYGVTNGSIIVGDLTVTGTCTGCGGSGDFTTYSTLLNQTVTGTTGFAGTSLELADDGSLVAMDLNSKLISVKSDGTIVLAHSFASTSTTDVTRSIVQTPDGKYFAILNSTSKSIDIYKNHILLQKIGVDMTQFVGGISLENSDFAFNISPNGKYIGLLANDVSNAIDRMIVFRGA